MLAILIAASLISLLDRPPKMPADADHVVAQEFPNKTCMGCHPADKMPLGHPIEYTRFECQRCHEQTMHVMPEQLNQKGPEDPAQNSGANSGPE